MTAAPLYDLKAFLRAAGGRHMGSLSAPEDRKDSSVDVEIVDEECAEITAGPANAYAFVDGIQNQMLVTYRGHRPVVLAYVAAGGASTGATLVALREQLAVVCSEEDVDWVHEVNPPDHPIPVFGVPSGTPPEVERNVLGRIQMMRHKAELELTTTLLGQTRPDHLVVLDGSLLGRENDPRLVSVVKTSRTKYMASEASLYGLPVGWRSPVFKIPEQAGTAARYSTYLRLHDATAKAWSFGMVRLEAFNADLLEPLAARALNERQGPHSGDGRYDRHLISVATCEKLLRARRPMVFDLFS